MQDLIDALTIFAKYSGSEYPTNCDHDILVVSVDPSEVNAVDRKMLARLGFEPNVADGHFYSYRFGSN